MCDQRIAILQQEIDVLNERIKVARPSDADEVEKMNKRKDELNEEKVFIDSIVTPAFKNLTDTDSLLHFRAYIKIKNEDERRKIELISTEHSEDKP
jgi:hypothetical protein